MSCIKGIGCKVSSQVVVSFIACPKLVFGTSENETTTCVRNSQPIPSKQNKHFYIISVDCHIT